MSLWSEQELNENNIGAGIHAAYEDVSLMKFLRIKKIFLQNSQNASDLNIQMKQIFYRVTT